MHIRPVSRQVLLIALALMGAGASFTASAAIITYNFTADPANFTHYPQTSTTADEYLGYLTNTASGAQSLPALTLNVGDTVEGTIKFSQAWTMPAVSSFSVGYWITLQQQLMTSYSVPDAINLIQSFSFYNNGVPVPVNNTYGIVDNSQGQLAFGKGPLNQAPAYTFDQIDYKVTVQSIDALYVGTQQSVSLASTAVSGAAPSFEWKGTVSTSTAPSPVPEPSTLVLFAFGLVGMGAARRKFTKCNG